MKKRLKILYAIQGTGNGHVARAREIIPILKNYGDLDIVLSGDQSQVELPVTPTYRSKGLTFIYNRSGGISYFKTLLKNNLLRIVRELWTFPVNRYDIVINDFEFITAWACKLRRKTCYGLGHQVSFLSDFTPRPKRREWLGELILRNYAPCSKGVGFHFDLFDDFIEKPVIRKEIRNSSFRNKGHYTVYLPAFGDDEIHAFLSQIPEKRWQVFSKFSTGKYQRGNITFFPTSNEGFIQSFVSCEGVFTSAGFETPAEALYMGKKVMVIPIVNQYEQFCNAAALESIGVPCIFKLNQETMGTVREWVLESQPVNIHYPDKTEQIIFERIITHHLEAAGLRETTHN